MPIEMGQQYFANYGNLGHRTRQYSDLVSPIKPCSTKLFNRFVPYLGATLVRMKDDPAVEGILL
jgi:hypothetical protein